MSQLQFQASISLERAIPLGDNSWDVQISLRDGEGVFRGNDISQGDVIVFDTGVVEVGTRYDITEVKGVSWTGEVELVIRFRDDNTNITPNPELSYLEGSTGVISRPSEMLGLLPVVSPSAQGMRDAFSFYMLNHNLVKVLDYPRSDGGGKTKLITAQWMPVMGDGRAPLPSVPIGDFVLNMGLAFLVDGSMVELLGITPEKDEGTGTWYAVIPPEDLNELQGQIGALTVSYLTEDSST